MDLSPLEPYGWNDRWAAVFADQVPTGAVPGRVVRHDGVALLVVLPDGIRHVSLRTEEPVAAGDWVVVLPDEGSATAVLSRTSLLRRRDPRAELPQLLAANVDVVVIVCGLDRPVKDGRIRRSAALAWDAGALPVVVLTKADAHPDPGGVADDVRNDNPGLDVLLTSVKAGEGISTVRALTAGRTVVLLGESGAGKSTLTNALMGGDVAATAEVRGGDAKGRHTTTTRELRLLPTGGVLIDTPGIREVGLWVDPDAVSDVFADIADIGVGCRFTDCAHDTEPGCAVVAAAHDGTLPAERLDAWHVMRKEAAAIALRADAVERRRASKRFGRMAREAQRYKRSP